MNPVIEFDRVDKIYRLGAERLNLRAALPGRVGRRPPAGHAALQDINLSIKPGESLGIVGANGAGKTTLLKIVARVVAPTRGSVTTRGTIASLIELGAGFHSDLTGTENVRFASVLLGMSRWDAARCFDEIVGFAGIDRFMDTPVKRYSTGMLARLGFAVASHLHAEVLAVDEVLSVGDAEFQARSFERMNTLRNSGCALLFVTHNLWAVPQVCARAIQLEHGRVIEDGPPDDVVNRYRARSLRDPDPREAARHASAIVEALSVVPSGIRPGEGIEVDATIRVHEALEDAKLLIGIERSDGLLCAGIDVDGSEDSLAKRGVIRLVGKLPSLPLLPDTYRIWLSVVQRSAPVVHDQAHAELAVIGQSLSSAIYGAIALDSDWSIDVIQTQASPLDERDAYE